MDRPIAIAGAILALITAIVGATVTIETRYAKAQEVSEALDELYAKQIKLRILEIDLKPSKTAADQALRQYLLQELQKSR